MLMFNVPPAMKDRRIELSDCRGSFKDLRSGYMNPRIYVAVEKKYSISYRTNRVHNSSDSSTHIYAERAVPFQIGDTDAISFA